MLQTADDIDPGIERIENAALQTKQNVQPFVLLVGQSWDSVTDSYVVIDRRTYNLENPIRAVEVCFKIFYSLHCAYSNFSKPVWLLIQGSIYELPFEKGDSNTAVSRWLKKFKNL